MDSVVSYGLYKGTNGPPSRGHEPHHEDPTTDERRSPLSLLADTHPILLGHEVSETPTLVRWRLHRLLATDGSGERTGIAMARCFFLSLIPSTCSILTDDGHHRHVNRIRAVRRSSVPCQRCWLFGVRACGAPLPRSKGRSSTAGLIPTRPPTHAMKTPV